LIGDINLFDPGNDFLGKYETTLAEIVAHQGRQFIAPLSGVKGRKNCGQIVLVVEEVAQSKHIITMNFRAHNLKRTRFWARLDPFLVFSRANEDGSFSVVHKTEYIRNKQWKPIIIKARTLCNGDYERAISIQVFDDRFNGQHKLIGQCFTTLSKLIKGPGIENTYDVCIYVKINHLNIFLSKILLFFLKIINPKKSKRSSGYQNSGKLELSSIVIDEEISFLDYIRGGTELHFAVAIDFTASNGDPKDPHSLHYFDIHGKPNSYEIALRSVGEIISQYNRNGKYFSFYFISYIFY
jgi:hypothetical protein